jgi:hypothetical protein
MRAWVVTLSASAPTSRTKMKIGFYLMSQAIHITKKTNLFSRHFSVPIDVFFVSSPFNIVKVDRNQILCTVS